ncbi:MAG: hypothetical protein ACFCD0_14245 [Gemmataceae bacterium]
MPTHRGGHRCRAFLALLTLALAFGVGTVTWTPAIQISKNERDVTNKFPVEAEGAIWTLDFRFKDPRIIPVRVPGRGGTRLCWYMWYQITNRTARPRTFIPSFELVTNDFPGVFYDVVLPSVQREIIKLEDKTGYQNIQNSVTIALKPIPPSKAENAFPIRKTGVAIWDASRNLDDPKKRSLSETTRFSIFISGLSNGSVLVDPLPGDVDQKPILRRKTLQLDYKRIGRQFARDSREFQFQVPHKWVYRSMRLYVPNKDEKLANPVEKMGYRLFPGPRFGKNIAYTIPSEKIHTARLQFHVTQEGSRVK